MHHHGKKPTSHQTTRLHFLYLFILLWIWQCGRKAVFELTILTFGCSSTGDSNCSQIPSFSILPCALNWQIPSLTATFAIPTLPRRKILASEVLFHNQFYDNASMCTAGMTHSTKSIFRFFLVPRVCKASFFVYRWDFYRFHSRWSIVPVSSTLFG